MDPADVQSYRPISNLSVASKLLERLVAQQLLAYLNQSGLLPRLQSAYRAGHSTETAVLKVLSDILLAINLSLILHTHKAVTSSTRSLFDCNSTATLRPSVGCCTKV